MIAEFGFTFADSKNVFEKLLQKSMAKSMAILFIFGIANDIAFVIY